LTGKLAKLDKPQIAVKILYKKLQYLEEIRRELAFCQKTFGY
jgi:hypothetical protein